MIQCCCFFSRWFCCVQFCSFWKTNFHLQVRLVWSRSYVWHCRTKVCFICCWDWNSCFHLMKTSVVICTNKKKWDLAPRIREICQNWISRVGFQNKSVFYPKRYPFQIIWNIFSEKICSLSLTWWNSSGVVSLLLTGSAMWQWTKECIISQADCLKTFCYTAAAAETIQFTKAAFLLG